MSVYAGMDMSAFPSLPFMQALSMPAVTPVRRTNLSWTAVYLSSPCHGDNAWMTVQSNLRALGWGTAPIYVGQQDETIGLCPYHNFAPAQGDADGLDAVAKATAAGCPPNSVVYFDWEVGSMTAPQIQHCRRWCAAVAASGFRPGFYAPPGALPAMRNAWPNLFIWVAQPGLSLASIVSVNAAANPPVVFSPPSPTQSAFPDAILWQCVWTQMNPENLGTPWPPGFVFPGIGHVQFPGLFNANDNPAFDIDLDSSAVADPCLPEARVDPAEVRQGRVTAVGRLQDTTSVLAVRRGEIRAHTWNAVNGSTSPEGHAAMELVLHPWAPLASLPAPAIAGVSLERVFVVGRSVNVADDEWRVLGFFNVPGTIGWQLDLVPVAQTSAVVDPLVGVSACARDATTLEVLAVDRTTGTLLSSSFTPVLAWTPFVSIQFRPNRSSGLVVHSRTAGVVDAFAVSPANQRVFTIPSPAPTVWAAPFAISHADLRAHPLSNFAVVSPTSDEIFLLFVARSAADPAWRVYETRWTQGNNWSGLFAFFRPPIGGSQFLPQPVSRLAAVSRQAQFIDLFVIGSEDGFLYNSFWNRQTDSWNAWRQIGGNPPVPLANVETALSRNPDAVDVLCSGADGNLYVTTWRAGLPDFTALTRLAGFDLQ